MKLNKLFLTIGIVFFSLLMFHCESLLTKDNLDTLKGLADQAQEKQTAKKREKEDLKKKLLDPEGNLDDGRKVNPPNTDDGRKVNPPNTDDGRKVNPPNTDDQKNDGSSGRKINPPKVK